MSNPNQPNWNCIHYDKGTFTTWIAHAGYSYEQIYEYNYPVINQQNNRDEIQRM